MSTDFYDDYNAQKRKSLFQAILDRAHPSKIADNISNLSWITVGDGKIDFTNENGLTALQLAAQEDYLEASILLTYNGAKLTEDVREYFNKKLCAAIWEGRVSEAIKLIDAVADVNYVDLYGWSPLHLALRKSDVVLSKLLVKAGADITKISSNVEAITPLKLLEETGIDLKLQLQDNPQEKLFLYEGPKINIDRMSKNPMHNLEHKSLLGKYFNLVSFCCQFSNLVRAIRDDNSPSKDVNIFFNAHGVTKGWDSMRLQVDIWAKEIFEPVILPAAPPPAPLPLLLFNDPTSSMPLKPQNVTDDTISFGVEGNINITPRTTTLRETHVTKANFCGTETVFGFVDPRTELNITPDKVCDAIAEAAGGKKLKIFFNACYGANIHDFLSKVKFAPGSVVITISNRDTVTLNTDFTYPDVIPVLEVLRIGNETGNLRIEDLLTAYCLFQRFQYNCPIISIFGQEGVCKTINLEEFFSAKVMAVDVRLSNNVKYLFAMRGISPEHISKLVHSSEYQDIRENKFKVPKELIGFELPDQDPQELVKRYSNYFHDGLEGFRWSSGANCPKNFTNTTPLMLHGGNNFVIPPNEDDATNYDMPFHSLFLTIAAYEVFAEMGNCPTVVDLL